MLGPQGSTIGRWWNTWEIGPYRRSLGPWRCDLKGKGLWDSFPFSFASKWAVLLHLRSLTQCTTSPQPKTMGPLDLGLETPNISLLPQAFHIVLESWLTYNETCVNCIWTRYLVSIRELYLVIVWQWHGGNFHQRCKLFINELHELQELL